jgi:4-hydroxy-tetrahydrodipicolinate synthase
MFRGTLAALVTPFRDGRLDLPALERLVRGLLDGGVDGFVPCGTTGESPTLTAEEQVAVVRTVVQAVGGRVPVIAGAGTNCTAKTVEHARAALAAGADAVMLVSPYYNRPTQEGLYRHFSHCARQISAPIMLYNIPGRTAVEMTVDTIARLRGEHANIAAVKHATGSLDGAGALAMSSDITILSGDDPLTLPLMSIGATGVVSVLANLVPQDVKSLTDAALASRWDDALSAHRHTYRLARDLLTLETNPIPIKTALALRGQMAEEFRLPMCPMSPENRRRLERSLQQYFGETKKS